MTDELLKVETTGKFFIFANFLYLFAVFGILSPSRVDPDAAPSAASGSLPEIQTLAMAKTVLLNCTAAFCNACIFWVVQTSSATGCRWTDEKAIILRQSL